MSAFANPYLIPELLMNPVPDPGEPPKTKVMVHSLPGSKFRGNMRQLMPPLST